MQIDDARELNRIAEVLQVRGEDGILLWLAKQHKGAYAIDIIKHFNLTPGRVANIMKKLEAKKFVTRKTASEDQRKALITLTPAGKKHAADVEKRNEAAAQSVLDTIGEEKGTAFVNTLQEIVALMRDGKIKI